MVRIGCVLCVVGLFCVYVGWGCPLLTGLFAINAHFAAWNRMLNRTGHCIYIGHGYILLSGFGETCGSFRPSDTKNIWMVGGEKGGCFSIKGKHNWHISCAVSFHQPCQMCLCMCVLICFPRSSFVGLKAVSGTWYFLGSHWRRPGLLQQDGCIMCPRTGFWEGEGKVWEKGLCFIRQGQKVKQCKGQCDTITEKYMILLVWV